jgi:glucose/arabinose dehydrogenase
MKIPVTVLRFLLPLSFLAFAVACNDADATDEAAPAAAVDFDVETVVSGLDTPWELVFLPDDRMLVTERPGQVRLIEDGQLRAEPMTVEGLTALEIGEGGLLGMTLDPAFSQNSWVYLYYTYGDGNVIRNRVVRYTLDGDRLTDRQVIVDALPGARVHNGGRIAFGPDGMLYVTAGDAADQSLAQDRDSLAGSILRYNSDGSIPADNPFPGSPIYVYGLRNPQGLAWEPGTGRLYATDHGPSARDEVNQIVPGANYGWPEVRDAEGSANGFEPPLITSGADTWAPSGATFVGGDAFPEWQGGILFAGLRSATLWHVDIANEESPALTALLAGIHGRLRQVVEGPDGLIYVLTNNRDGRGSPTDDDDRIIRLVPR